MSGEAVATTAAIEVLQLLLASLATNLAFTSYLCPISASIDTITSTSFDYIIVGGGSAGSVLANRLSACSDANVLLLEAGGCPPLESTCTGYFTLLPNSQYDYNMTSVNDAYACQGLQGGSSALTSGHMLGGSSSIHHVIHVRGCDYEYNKWVTATNDSSWSLSNLLPYFIKSETVYDSEILSQNASTSGTEGPTGLKRQKSSLNTNLFTGLDELGYQFVDNINSNISLGYCEPLLEIGEDNLRQSGLVSYIYPVKDRSNLYVLTGATVNKVNFDSSNVATGVTFTYSDTSYTVAASSEVILSAGAIKTPQLLMLSGVGPSDHLTEKNITVVSDLPVGQNLQDHVAACLLITLQEDNSTASGANPFEFPTPMFTVYANLTDTESSTQQCPEYQNIALTFPKASGGLLQLCMNGFQFNSSICDAMYAATTSKYSLLSVPNLLHPVSTGKIILNTTDVNDQPLVYLNLLNENEDLVNLAAWLNETAQLVNTTYFKSVGAEVQTLGLCSNETLYSTEFWQCYALAMSSTMWHYSGTASMGSVVDTNLKVKGVSNLRVVDASVMAAVPGGNINAAVLAVAEKIADVIITDRGSCTS